MSKEDTPPHTTSPGQSSVPRAPAPPPLHPRLAHRRALFRGRRTTEWLLWLVSRMPLAAWGGEGTQGPGPWLIC